MLLEMKDAVLNYGKIQALHGISLEVNEGEVVSLIGANGAGKTSTMRALSGVRGLHSGSVAFDGQDVTRLRADQRLRKGLVLCPEGRGIFPGMTVTENLNMGAYTRKDKAEMAQDFERVFGLFPRLKERHKQVAGTMSGGEQQMLAIGRALMARPRLLCLDEPSMGLAPKLIQQIFDIITEIAEQGTTILVVEQNAKQALSRSHRGYVLETGKIVKTGNGSDLLGDPSIREAYLGVA
jgi:branched-chain amino acid transport system ATP-binding protein